MKILTWNLPIKTISEMNQSEHWTKKHKRHKQQQEILRLLIQNNIGLVQLPCHIKLTRLSPRQLDPDNLPPALKYIQDELAEMLTGKGGFYITKKGKVKAIKGHADNDKRMTWEYTQEKSARIGVRITIQYE
jgi:hypothetical protein